MTIVSYVAVALLLCTAMYVRGQVLRQTFLLAASYILYGTWGLGFLAVLIVSSVVNFGLGEWIRRQPTLARIATGVGFNVLLLSFFKYLPAFASGEFFHSIAMPVGVSFWTFQALSYLFDTYREEETRPSLLEFCLYMAFWPTVTMGPICRLAKLLPQFREPRTFSSSDFEIGLRRIATGLFMKVALAGLLASTLSARSESGGGFDEIGKVWGGLDVWFLAVGFGFQLFFDFAGYSHIVIGAARLFGFHLEENFAAPYLATTPAIFWTRWHMSLSSWIRDYAFMPAARLRRETWWRHFALLFSMVLFGLWHSAQLTFVLWGAYHGVFLILHRIGQQLRRRFGFDTDGGVGSALSWMMTFFGVSLGWILFRARDVQQAGEMFKAVFMPATYSLLSLPENYYRLLLAMMIGYFAYHLIANSSQVARLRERQYIRFPMVNRWWWLTPIIAVVTLFAGLISLSQRAPFTPFMYRGF